MSLNKIKIVAKGWENFTGEFCQVEFKDGVSVAPLPRLMSDRVAAIVAVELLDENDESIGQGGVTARFTSYRQLAIDAEAKLDTMTEEEREAENKAAIEAALKNPASTIYSPDQLEAIASTEGLKGLRKIGDLWGVRERSITKLITLILRAQSEYQKRLAEKDAETQRAREAANAEALAKQAAHEAEIDAKARLVTGAPPVIEQQPSTDGSVDGVFGDDTKGDVT